MINKKLIALIPARAGSERIKDKNFKNFCGSPLILYAIIAAFVSETFHDIVVSTNDSSRVKKLLDSISNKNGLRDVIKKRLMIRHRSDKISTSSSPDCEWIADVFNWLGWDAHEHFMILRPTNPFRTQATIQRAWKVYKDNFNMAISMKSMSPISERPEKMWRLRLNTNKLIDKIHPVLDPITTVNTNKSNGRGYEMQSSVMVPLFIQNGCIDICPVSIIKEDRNSYIGDYVSPFYTAELEGFDINSPLDWDMAEALGLKIRANLSQNIAIQSSNRVH